MRRTSLSPAMFLMTSDHLPTGSGQTHNQSHETERKLTNVALFAGYRAATIDVAQSLGLREEELEDELGAQELRSMIQVRRLHLLCVSYDSVKTDPK